MNGKEWNSSAKEKNRRVTMNLAMERQRNEGPRMEKEWPGGVLISRAMVMQREVLNSKGIVKIRHV